MKLTKSTMVWCLRGVSDEPSETTVAMAVRDAEVCYTTKAEAYDAIAARHEDDAARADAKARESRRNAETARTNASACNATCKPAVVVKA